MVDFLAGVFFGILLSFLWPAFKSLWAKKSEGSASSAGGGKLTTPPGDKK